MPKDSFEQELAQLLNRHGMEKRSNTPDYILAHYLNSCLHAFESASVEREQWYGESLYPGKGAGVPK